MESITENLAETLSRELKSLAAAGLPIFNGNPFA